MKEIYRPHLFLVLLLAFTNCQKEHIQNSEAAAPPNIIYVLTDDLGYGDLSCYNPNGKVPTTSLDRLAAEGMLFTDAHTSSSVCTPTRYGILTGRYNWRSRLKQGVLWGQSKALIPQGRETAGSLLQKAGYQTAFIGKWHLGWDWALKPDSTTDFSQPISNGPNTLGFDYSYGHAASLDIPPYVYVENGQPTAIPTERTENKDYQGFWRNGLTAPDFVHEQVTPHFFDKSIQWIQEQQSEASPFFLYLALPSPHTPILPTAEWQGKSGLNPYADFVMMVDGYMGKLDQAVQDAGIAENTIIIFTSDNGCSPRAKFAELAEKGHYPSHHFRGHKADIFEGGHRVPFIVKWPAAVKANSRSSATICTTDFMATCADLTGQTLSEDAGEDSFSLLPLLTGKGAFDRHETVHHSIEGEFAIRQGDWKLIMCPGSGGWSTPKPGSPEAAKLPKKQLYHLQQDPGETQNLIAKYPEKADELTLILADIVTNGRSTKGPKQQNDGPMPWPQLHWLPE